MVTGATGLLGSHLLCHLARCGETIIALKRYKSHVEETMALFSCYFDSPEVKKKEKSNKKCTFVVWKCNYLKISTPKIYLKG